MTIEIISGESGRGDGWRWRGGGLETLLSWRMVELEEEGGVERRGRHTARRAVVIA
jgi:hypothetical protein